MKLIAIKLPFNNMFAFYKISISNKSTGKLIKKFINSRNGEKRAFINGRLEGWDVYMTKLCVVSYQESDVTGFNWLDSYQLNCSLYYLYCKINYSTVFVCWSFVIQYFLRISFMFLLSLLIIIICLELIVRSLWFWKRLVSLFQI